MMGASTTASSNDEQQTPPTSSMETTNGGISQPQQPEKSPPPSNLDTPSLSGAKQSRQSHVISNSTSSEAELYDGSSATENNASTNKFRLRWDNFPQSVVSSFRRLKEEEDFVDVTLACNSKQFTAHKVVLSACSPYFRRLLKVRFYHYLCFYLNCVEMFILRIIKNYIL